MSSTLPPAVGGPRFAPVALDPEAGTAFGDPWPARIVAERGIERVIRVHGRPDVIHLRMADAGTLAAANVAARLGIPTVFSLAPDPHGLIASREASGDLDRRSFGTEDANSISGIASTSSSALHGRPTMWRSFRVSG